MLRPVRTTITLLNKLEQASDLRAVQVNAKRYGPLRGNFASNSSLIDLRIAMIRIRFEEYGNPVTRRNTA